jgi:2-polyprenyl-6-methoxyphenol hydroxylase-like FAD-dependent oxidoreductase
MAGLLAARVLADFYRTVTVVERDVLPDEPLNRRGVPQGRMIHAIQGRGLQIMDELFPGFLDELEAGGVPAWDGRDFSKFVVSIGGHRLGPPAIPNPLPMPVRFPSRPYLEWSVRRRVRAIPNVTILEDHDVAGLIATADRRRITGARVVNRASATETTLPGDLIIDATGRGSRMPAFLDELGYGRPAEDELMVHLAYTCQLMRVAPGTVDVNMIGNFPEPGRPRMFAFIRYENNTYMFGVGTMAGLEPPSQRADMLDFAADLAPAHVLAALRAAEPLEDVGHYRVPSNRWRRYDKMRRTPEGLLVVGDAVCSFNPIYGQGMTVAAIEATVLRDCLRGGERELPSRFFRGTAKYVRVAWQTAVGSDLALPEISGARPFLTRVSNAYLERVLAAAESDAAVAGQFIKVIGMVDSPSQLVRPAFVLRVARTNLRRRTMAHPSMTNRLQPAAAPTSGSAVSPP